MNGELKYNYYDVLRRNRPQIFSYIEKDLESINFGDVNNSYGSTDEYSKHFMAYFDEIFSSVVATQQSDLRSKGYDYTIDVLKQKVAGHPMYNQLGNSCHVDYLTMTNFEIFGKKTFYFSDNLIEQLALTSLDIPSGFIMPPFPCCQFVIRSPIAVDALYRISSNGSKKIDSFTPISTFVMLRPSEEGARKLVFASWHASYKSTHLFAKRELLIRKEWNIEDTLRTDWQDIYDEELEKEQEVVDESKFRNEGILFYRILLNCLLYLGSNDPEIIESLSPSSDLKKMEDELLNIKSHSKRKEIKRQFYEWTSLNSSIVGSGAKSIVVDKHNLDGTNQQHGTKKSKLEKRFIVRGHWKNQTHGQDNSLRKLIFIQPYFKGPDMAEIVNKSYEVK